jgi:hypothetical protein
LSSAAGIVGGYIRRMKTRRLFYLLIAASSWLPAMGQAAPTANSSTSPSQAQRQAAEALLGTLYSEASFNTMIDQRLAAQFKVVPDMQQYEPELRAFLNKYLSWASIKPEMVALYAQEFTEAELREMTRFYQSPTGQKAIARVPVLRQMALDIGLRRFQEHMPEFQEMLSKKNGGN